jgi:hypothetical protein
MFVLFFVAILRCWGLSSDVLQSLFHHYLSGWSFTRPKLAKLPFFPYEWGFSSSIFTNYWLFLEQLCCLFCNTVQHSDCVGVNQVITRCWILPWCRPPFLLWKVWTGGKDIKWKGLFKLFLMNKWILRC